MIAIYRLDQKYYGDILSFFIKIGILLGFELKKPGAVSKKILSHKYRDSDYEDTTVPRRSYLYNSNSYTWKGDISN